MWRRVDLVRTDVSEERLLTQNLHGATTEDGILDSHRRENLKSYICYSPWRFSFLFEMGHSIWL
jgi:hypothetical protein